MIQNGKRKLTLGIREVGPSCDGCQMTIVNLDEVLLRLEALFNIIDWRIAVDGTPDPHVHYDVLLAEGVITTEEDEEKLRDLRKRTTILIAIGACAVTAGIPGAAPSSATEDGRHGKHGVLTLHQGPRRPVPLHDIVEVDWEIPGCPIDIGELLGAIGALLAGGKPTRTDTPVCEKCPRVEDSCLLHTGHPCLGTITQGGCHAICTKAGADCWGCRGILPEANIGALINTAARRFNIPREDFVRRLTMANAPDPRVIVLKEERSGT